MDWIHQAWEWAKEREALLTWVGSLSLFILIVSAIAVPIAIQKMPHDYFLNKSEEVEAIRESHPILRILFLIFKNLLGAILLLGGILMLITPGQGLLTIVIGLLLMNFPGKRRFEIWLVSLGPIHRAIQWIRKRGGKQPLEIPRASQPQASSENS